MSAPANKSKKVEKRNLFITIPDEAKKKLKDLARASHMTMETYVCAVLEEAVKNRDTFTFVKKKKEETSQDATES